MINNNKQCYFFIQFCLIKDCEVNIKQYILLKNYPR